MELPEKLPEPLPSGSDGPAMEPAPVACRNARCPKHGQLVTPEGERGVCPSCKAALPGSTLARKTPPIDKSKVKQLAERFKSDFKPATQSLVTTCEQLATVTERLEKVKPGSVEHQRLFQMWQQLTDRLESSRPEARAPGTTSPVVILPDNHREWDERVERGDDLLRELRGENRTPGASEPSRVEAVGSDAPAASDDLLDQFKVPERIVSGHGVTLKVETRMRRITESEIEACLDACGDLRRYRSGEIDRATALAWTAAWLKSQWNEREL